MSSASGIHSSLIASFQRGLRLRRDDGFRHLAGGFVQYGFEIHKAGAPYRWDGLRRVDDPAHPRVVFQATLAGAGVFEQGERRWSLEAPQAFFAVLPSAHVYEQPAQSPGWTFFWFNFGHPFMVGRLIALTAKHGPVFPVAADSKLMAQSLTFFEMLASQRFEDAFAEEAALLNWMLEFERHLHELAHPRSQREAWLEEVRRYTLGNLKNSFGIDELARARGLSRSHFSHRFQAATGQAPAAYVLEIRLTEVRRRLRETSAPLKDIAAATGFADANHLCKAFRRHFHMSPGGYRGR